MSQMGNLISKAEARGGAAAEEGGAKAEQERTERVSRSMPRTLRGPRLPPTLLRVRGSAFLLVSSAADLRLVSTLTHLRHSLLLSILPCSFSLLTDCLVLSILVHSFSLITVTLRISMLANVYVTPDYFPPWLLLGSART